MPPLPRPVVAAVICLALLPGVSGCGRPNPEAGPAPPVQRLARVILEGMEAQRNARAIPLDEQWRAEGGALEADSEGMRLTTHQAGASFSRPLEASGSAFNVLRARLKCATGVTVAVDWCTGGGGRRSARAPEFTAFAGNEFHEYRVPLVEPGLENTTIGMDRILLRLPEGVQVAIGRLELAYEPPDAPPRITLDHVMLEAYPGDMPPWTLRVPPDALFESYVALQRDEEHSAAPAVFRVTMRRRSGKEEVVAVGEARNGAWARLRASLGRYAGEEVTLRLTVDTQDPAFGGRAWWGAPTVYRRVPDATAIPIILISCDTLRADHLSCYGYARNTTPVLDVFAARDAVCFENAIVEQTQTLPSHMTMLTGLDPKHHRTTPGTNLAEDVVTLPEMLQEHGYLTAGFNGHGWWLAPWRGFGQGFDYYDNAELMFRHVNETTPRMVAWLEGHHRPALFLFFHAFDIHYKIEGFGAKAPYDSADPSFRQFSGPLIDSFRPFATPHMEALLSGELLKDFQWKRMTLADEEHAVLKAGYDDCIRLVDAAIGNLFGLLKSYGLYDQALIIVTADHGESLNEHGRYGHADVYEEICRVPLLIKFPDRAFAGQRYAGQVQHADLCPTVLEVLGISAPKGLDGQSLRAVLRGEAAPRRLAFVQRLSKRAVRGEEWKLRWDSEDMDATAGLYSLEQVPAEKTDRKADAPEVFARLKAEGLRFFSPSPEGWHIRLWSAGTPWRAQLHVASDAEITEVFQIDENEQAYPKRAAGPRELQHTLGEMENEHLVIKTKPEARPLSVALHASDAFDMIAGGEPRKRGATYTATLPPTGGSAPHIESPDTPVVAIWYEVPAQRQTTAPEPTTEIKEQLEALGYTQ